VRPLGGVVNLELRFHLLRIFIQCRAIMESAQRTTSSLIGKPFDFLLLFL
jgi:hypothetical protein